MPWRARASWSASSSESRPRTITNSPSLPWRTAAVSECTLLSRLGCATASASSSNPVGSPTPPSTALAVETSRTSVIRRTA
jgi:hypothetical protein